MRAVQGTEPRGCRVRWQKVGYLRAPCTATPRLKHRLHNSISGTGRLSAFGHQKRAVEAPKAPAKLVQTNRKVADRLGDFIAASRGTVGDFLLSVIY